MRFVAMMFFVMLAACATTSPTFSGGSTTPEARLDFALGSASSFAFGRTRKKNPGQRTLTPLAFARYGLSKTTDASIMMSYAGASFEIRREFIVQNGVDRRAFTLGAKPRFQMLGDSDDLLVGIDFPLAFNVEVGGLYELWVGGKFSAGYLNNADVFFIGSNANAETIGAGAFLGLALGFRRVHAMIEINADYQYWMLDGENKHVLVLTPAFALRFRI